MTSPIAPPTRPSEEDPLIVRLLSNINRLDPERLVQLYSTPIRSDVPFEELVIQSGLADENWIAEAYASHYLMPLFDPPSDSPPPVDPSVAQLLPRKFCCEHRISPLSDDGQTLEVALISPDSLVLADEIKLLTGRQMRPLFATLSVVKRLLDVLYEADSGASTLTDTSDAILDKAGTADELDRQDARRAGEVVHLGPASPPDRDGHIMRYLFGVFEQALQVGASDIHIEPYDGNCRVRLRIDGVLTEITPPPMALLGFVVRRLKVLSKMDVAQCRLPQHGTIGLRSGDHRVDVRVNTCPTVDGEKVVMRVLDRNALPHEIGSLGLDERQLRDLSDAILSPHGLMLVTGPTGSGKSTTLYSCLNFLNDSETNICTVEDPVEFKLGGINQVQTCDKVGWTFASAVRSFLCQDPDVIMVGEMRDNETAEICVRAAITGHVVLSTLHADDALSSVMRLQNMGIEPFLLSNTLSMLVAQRLLRRLCDECKLPQQIDRESAERCGIDPKTVIFGPRGCSRCRDTGYHGRLAVFEIIRINRRLSEMIRTGRTLEAMKRAAVADGMSLLPRNAITKVISGETGLEEALSICVNG